MKIATWNINSVRLRIDSVLRFLKEEAPDVLCLQEIKCRDEQFPARPLRSAGYEHIAVSGQAGYHGVAIIARAPLKDVETRKFCGKDDCRHIAATLPGGVRLHNFYVPSGGDEPDPAVNDKFAHKLDFMKELAEWSVGEAQTHSKKAVLVGDLNIAPREHDVWSHRQLLNVVSHTPVEVELMNAALEKGKWTDVARELIPEPEKLYTWWSYRARDWRASNRGRRLDHIWTSPPLRKAALSGGRAAFAIHDHCRDWERPSDHVPVTLTLDL
ncbi:exodeoxyribonuclease III [Amphiplicatus metriothermophilus]|uniref:Exodeoxyribonuclease-3 n=1 Tax=Amphiplicatus metriothermophilus TaxID=1519374 RepID=A0A239PKZ3_9PROT|nr:exodeoxyribonuclease III [Amphiplicatus metriothermophilus]MBB5517687.1 exodeoxyribonuclease-3 [Amphiplicatus metriothermophilus]SNT67979.1 exodeoxyribonuclease-3 [Amphiplicatus metriothermophilus]